jgi:hypothetical protein
MKGLPFVLLFTAMTFLAWGAYGPVLHHGTLALDKDSLRAFVGVGLAYFLIAVLIPIVILRSSKEVGKWTVSGIILLAHCRQRWSAGCTWDYPGVGIRG